MIHITQYLDIYRDDVISLILKVYEKDLGLVGYERPDIYKIDELYKYPKSNFWVMLDNEKVIGTVAVLEHTPEIAFLKRMVLQKDYRKRGLGKQLLDTAIDFAKKCGYKKLYAGTVEKNPNAISFYKHLGFTLCDDVPIGITADSNSICLEKELESLAK